MKKKRFFTIIAIVVLFAIVAVGVVYAEDGIMFRRNISKTPDQETERANLMGMAFYVPSQNSTGELVPIEYFDFEDVLVDTREFAKPLVAVYIDSLLEEHEEEMASIMSGAGFGAHDAYTALSLDDGTTWKRTNLSMSADLSSFNLADGHAYPGDAHNMTLALAGDKVLVGWISKYCDGGSPAYTWTDTDDAKLYPDIWGVAGAQSSVDYTAQGFPGVGEIPYSCVWAARGTLLEVDTDGVPAEGGGFYDIIWTKAERLTSGRRDANRLEMNGDGAAGFMMTWQEDPEGLRPGTGLGPGEGWSGAVVNQQTDLWYSYISIADFEMVFADDSDDAEAISIYDFTGDTMPKVAAPMALPVRLTDNKMCKVSGSDPYCYVDFDNVDEDGNLILPDDLDTIAQSLDSTLCSDTVSWLNPGGTILNLCIAKDGRVMQGRVGASRPRVNVQPFDADGDGVYDNAWVIMGAEESKALGEGAPDDPGGGQPEEEELIDVGKNMWYYSFDMLNPEVVMQGGMLNQPAECTPGDAIDEKCTLDEFYPLLYEDWNANGEIDPDDSPFYETEISRRFSHFSQPIHQIGDAGVSAVLIVKQGILKQGGPADIFLRRLLYEATVYDDLEYTYTAPIAPNCSGLADLDGDEIDDMDPNITGAVVDALDNGLSCVSIDLYLVMPDESEVLAATLLTDEYGNYVFQDVEGNVDPNLEYVVEVTDTEGVLALYDPPTSVEMPVSVADADVIMDDFVFSTQCNGIADLGGVDTDILGSVVDASDNGLSCVSLNLYQVMPDESEVHAATLLTDETGSFTFLGAESDTDYIVEVTDTEGVLALYDPPTPVEMPVSVANADVIMDNIVFSALQCTGIYDMDGDDIDSSVIANIEGVVQDETEAGIACVSVELQLPDGAVLASVYTDEFGNFAFWDVGPRDYVTVVTDEAQVLEDYTPTTEPPSDEVELENPYAFENMACNEWTFTDGSNPRYIQGLCLSNMINVSGGTIVSCDNGTSGDDCAEVFPWDGQEDIGTEGFPKVTEWRQCGGESTLYSTSGEDNYGCADNDLDDQSWENPYDVAKGHRGFIDGNFILMMYAWSPNWQANSVGNDHYNLYARRSFDGGVTWTTTPADLEGVGELEPGLDEYQDPTACENYKIDNDNIKTVCFTYGAGDFEQSRNLSQLVGNKETILDPRYSPTGGIKMLPITDLKEVGFTGYDDDIRDRSKFFIVYETGDNTTVATGEAVPLDLFYSRAVNWGDDYDLRAYEKDSEIELSFDWLEHDREDLSGEAANLANNGGTYYYAIWNQWQEDEEENVSESDAIFRRIMYLDEDDRDNDAVPSTAILYVSSTRPQYGDELVLVGSAWDNDHIDGLPYEDIAEVVWTDTFDGVETVIDDGDDDPRRLNYPVKNLQPGWHEFGFKASDKGGKWSPGVTVGIMVYETRYDLMLPAVINP